MLELIRISFQIYWLELWMQNGLGGRLWEAKGYHPFHCFSSDQICQYWLPKLYIEFNFLFLCQVFRLQNQVNSSTYKGILWWTQYSTQHSLFLTAHKCLLTEWPLLWNQSGITGDVGKVEEKIDIAIYLFSSTTTKTTRF